jgi:hypothetical protein
MKFENIPKKIKEGVKSTTKIGLLGLGLLGVGCEDENCNQDPSETSKDLSKNNIDENRENPIPEDYDLIKINSKKENKKLNLSDLELKKSLDSTFIEQSILLSLSIEKLNKETSTFSKILQKIQDTINTKKDISEEIRVSLVGQQEKIDEISNSINKKDFLKIKNELSENEKKYLDIAPKLYKIVESVRKEIILSIRSKDYLHKLQMEFNCSEKEAYNHQQVRLSNLNIANYLIVGPSEVLKRSNNKTSTSFFNTNSNMIIICYSLDLTDFYDTVLHEMMHLVVNGEGGMSNSSINLLGKDSFGYRSDYSKKNNEYLSSPTERYTRLKILERELANKNIKKIEEEFTYDHYLKMYDLYKKGKFLLPGSLDFLNFTKSKLDVDKHFELIKKLFDEIAEIDKNKKGNTYKDQNWNYENPTNLA